VSSFSEPRRRPLNCQPLQKSLQCSPLRQWVSCQCVASPLSPRPPTLIDVAWQITFRAVYPVAGVWWQLRRSRHEGALVAVHVGRSVLLVRSSYRSEWNFPGGSIHRRETPEVAARRELAEEVGLTAYRLHSAGQVCGLWDGQRDRVHVFEMRLERLPQLQFDNREIVDARLASVSELSGLALTGAVVAYLRRRPIG
jgi:8-oxo-dGTP diphosphatase